MLCKLRGMWDRDFVEDEISSVNVFQCILYLISSFDGFFEVGNDIVTGDFDPENFMIIISQDPAVNGEVGSQTL